MLLVHRSYSYTPVAYLNDCNTMLYYKRQSGVLGEDLDLADIRLFPLLQPFHKPMTWQRARANLGSGSIHTSRSSLISLVCILWVDIGHLAGHHEVAEREQCRRQSEPGGPINIVHTCLPSLHRRRHRAESHVRPHRHLPPCRSS